MFSKVVFVLDMEQRGREAFVLTKDVPILLGVEESALNMGLNGRLVVMKDVLTKYRKIEYVSDMVPRLRKSFAVMKDVQIRQGREEFVVDMLQRGRSVVMKDVQM